MMSAMTVASMVLVGCGAKTFVVYSPGENLTSLTKVNESEYVCFFHVEVMMDVIFSL